jgi:general secretion pathway protein J
MNNRFKITGFTLVELLIAITVFSIMAVIVYGGVRLVMDGKQQLEQSADSLSSLQRSFLFLQQDIEQILPRSVRDELGSQEAAFVCCADEKLLQLTRGGVRGGITGGSDLRRVEYHLENGILERRVWSTLDRVQEDKPSRFKLIDNVLDFEVNILGYGGSGWGSTLSSEKKDEMSAVPRAVEIIITTERFGAVSRLFVIGS